MKVSRSDRSFLLLAELASIEAASEAIWGARLAEVLGRHLPLLQVSLERSGEEKQRFAGLWATRPSKRAERLAVQLSVEGRPMGICWVELGQDAKGLAMRVKWGDAWKEALARGIQGSFRLFQAKQALSVSTGSSLKTESPEVDSATGQRSILSLEDTIRQAILEALRSCSWRIYGPQGAASRLGLRPTTLQSKMKKLQIDRYDEG